MVQCLADAFFLSLAKFGPRSGSRVVAQSPRSCVGIGKRGGGGVGGVENATPALSNLKTRRLRASEILLISGKITLRV